MKIVLGVPVLFLGLFTTGFYLAECFSASSNCFVELLLVTIPISWIGFRLLREFRWITGIVAGIVAIVIGMLIANPNSLRSRIEVNEERALADARAVIAAEEKYASANDGYYGHLDCLERPAECIASYPIDGPAFLSEPVDGVRYGFIRKFIPGPPDADEAPSNSIRSYPFIAYPEAPGSGVRSYCASSDGTICVTIDGLPPITEGGACKPECAFLE